MTHIPARDQDDGAPDTCTAAYDENFLDLSPEEGELCDKSPAGQCQYSRKDNHRRCIHCGRKSEIQ